jgi:hypothetical protein
MAGGMTLPDGDANKTRGIQDGTENKAYACKGCVAVQKVGSIS